MTCILIGFLMCTPQMPQQTFLATTSAYTCDIGSDCIMANGKVGHVGAVACSRKIPLGSKLRVSGVVYTCEDRLNRRFDDRVDIFMDSRDEAIIYGLQVKEIEIL
jgi:3D (Asp-Asp-Asp) domain-containing protein